MAIDLKKVKMEAQEEVQKECQEKAKKLLKAKMRELAKAKQVVTNIETELQDLEMEIADGSAFAEDGCS